MKKSLKAAFIVAVAFVLFLMFCGCDLPPSKQDELKAAALKVAAKDATILFLKNNPKYRDDIITANSNIIDVLQSGKIPTYKHLQVFLAMFKVNQEMQGFAQDLYSLFALYVNLSGKDPIAMMSKRDLMFLLNFCAGIKEGSVK